MRPFMLGLVGAGGMLFVTSLSHAQCTKDTDCKGERVCEAGACVAAAGTPSAPEATTTAPEPAPAAAPEPQPAQLTQQDESSAPAFTRAGSPKMKRHSTGMMVGGIVMVSLAPVALIVSGMSGLLKFGCEVSHEHRDCDDSYNPVIYGSLLSSVVLVGVGLPLLIVGAKREPVEPGATATISPWVTPRAAGIGLRVDM